MPVRLPKITVITPSLNQAKFIESSIKSVLDQNYPNLEYIIIDGGSTDGTLNILKKYGKKILWTSEKDNGQSSAINRGIKKSSGEIIYYGNSDDYLAPESLSIVADFFRKNKNAAWITGKCRIVDEYGVEVRKFITFYKNIFLKYFRTKEIFFIVQFISQPSTFWRAEVVKKIGLFDESLTYDMDYDYWLRIWQKFPLYFLDKYLSSYRVHKSSKAVVSPETQFRVEYEIVKKYRKNNFLLFLHYLHARISLFIYRKYLLKKP